MSCNKCGNRSHCRCTLKAVCVEVAGGVETITVEPAMQYVNKGFYAMRLCPGLPEIVGTEPVDIADGLGSYPLIDTDGQPVTAGMLRPGAEYRLRYGSGGVLSSGSIPPHFTVYECLRGMEYSSNPALQSC